jgi:hypothetical protein
VSDVAGVQRLLLRRELLRKSGAILLVGTDSGEPTQFGTQTTWNELDV